MTVSATGVALAAAIAVSVPRPSAHDDGLPARTSARGQSPLELVPDEDAVRQLSPALRAQLAANPYVYFRFINVPWMRAVCDQFADVLPGIPTVRLHGDPHLEQYAFTSDSHGLDDFDDSASGPYVVDLTRFLASVGLALRARGWNSVRTRAIDAFFAGYRTALVNAGYLPPDPAVIDRLRAAHPRSPEAFLAWAESLMLPLDPAYEAALPPTRDALERYVHRVRPDTPPGYFTIKRAGQTKLGVGSALAPKVLMRLEGPTSSDADDVILEVKRAGDLGSVPCLTVATSAAVRVVTGARQIGRIHHELMVVLRRSAPDESDRWWVRSWDRTYREVDIADYASGTEIVEVARDVGAQLGRGHFHDTTTGRPRSAQPDARRQLDALEPRIRRIVETQTRRLLDDWARFAARTGRQ